MSKKERLQRAEELIKSMMPALYVIKPKIGGYESECILCGKRNGKHSALCVVEAAQSFLAEGKDESS